LRVANFVDSCLTALERKGNLGSAPDLYNPGLVADSVIHFTACPDDARFSELFAASRVAIVPYFERAEDRRSPLAYWQALRRIRARMRLDRVTLVRGRLPYFAALLGILAARPLGVPSIVSLGGDNRIGQRRSGSYYFGSRLLSYGIEELVLRLATLIVVPNAFTARYVAGLLGPRAASSKIVTIPWRIQRDPSSPDADASRLSRLELPRDRELLLVVGALNPYKFADVLFDVADRLEARAPGRYCTVFCGEGPLAERGRARFAGRPHALLVGWQAQGVVRALIRRAGAVLVPMSGFVLLEAAADGRRVVAADVEWHSELIRDGETGRLVDPESVESWVEAIAGITANAGLSEAMGDRLRARFEAAYAPELVLAQEKALYLRFARSERA